MGKIKDTNALLTEIEELKNELSEANSIIDAIREGAVDALVVHKDGTAEVYSIESADYTYRILIEKFGEGALSISNNGLILYCNDYFSKLIGIPASKITGTSFQQYLDTPERFTLLRDALETGQSKGEIIFNGPDGDKLHAYVSLTDLQPHVEAFGVVVTDLTAKIRHEKALLEYQRQLEMKIQELNMSNTSLEQFIHVISHDIKEPLRKILTYSSHLNETKGDLLSVGELKSLNVINSSAMRLNSLVDDLVKYAFSATRTDIAIVNLNNVLKEVIDDLELVISENKAVVTADDLPIITGSKVQMRQLFSNLISNAVKYSRNGITPEIRISNHGVDQNHESSFTSSYNHIAVSDNGIGMEESQLPKIFTIFQRLHMREEYSGNGIGLAICKKIMENHHGRIEVESKVNHGTSFHLYFPSTL